MDGVLDWYLLGLGAGLGTALGLALRWLAQAGPARALAASVCLTATVGVVLATTTVLLWALPAALLGLAAALVATRRLARSAFPAAALVALALAPVPAGGYASLLALALVRARLARQAGERHAGLRILARD